MTRAALIGVVALFVAGASPSHAQRTVPSPIVGVTFDNVSKVAAKVTALSNIAKFPTLRVVFDAGTSPSDYSGALQKFRPVSYIMGELVDSSYMQQYSVSGAQSWAMKYANALWPLVDIWEIGNEINGDWLGANAFAKMAAMFDVIYARGGKTALTFFYEGEKSERGNCIDNEGGMFPWIARYFDGSPEAEKIRLHLDYVLISWYPSQCKGENPEWVTVFTKLAGIFPNSKVGFGELGTPRPQRGSAYEKNLISTYYPMGKTVPGLPPSYVGGYFWWYGSQEFVPWPGSLSTAT